MTALTCTILALSGAATAANCGVKETERAGRPNILLALSDDQSWPHAGAYGYRAAKTPAFDRIAHNGVLFTHAFCAASQCSISRANLLTGRHLWQLDEAGVQASLFPAHIAVYTDLLQSAGYHVGYTGKPWGPGNWRAAGRLVNPSGKAWNKRKLKPPTALISTTDYAANFAEFLSDRPGDTPFCFWYGCHEPHRNYEEGSGLRSGRKPQDAVVPPFFPDNDTVRSDLLDYYLEIEWFDRHLGLMIEQLERIGELENTLILVTSDNGMPFPRTKATLYEDGIRMPFAVQWPARIRGGRTVDDLVSFVDVAPTFLEAAGIESSSSMSGRSLMPLLDGNPTTTVQPHRSFVLLGKERHNHARAGNVGYPVRGIRTDRFLYLRNMKPDRWPMGDPPGYFCHTKLVNPTKAQILSHKDDTTARAFELTYAKRGPEELYDVRNDPHCLQDLAQDPGHTETRQRLWSLLKRELTEQGDPRVLGSGDVFDSYPFFGRIQPDIPGFKQIGQYNPALWPASRGPIPKLNAN